MNDFSTWSIAEQVVSDNATGLRFEFDATDPNTSTLRVFTKERTRVLVLMFQRDGALLKSDVRGVRDGQLEDVGQAAFQELHQDPAVADAATKAAADVKAHELGVDLVQVAKDVLGVKDPPPAGDLEAAIGAEGVPDDANGQAPKKQGVFYG